ncbi:hypothetical protein MC885_004100, partial [Smutsia gigantea]
MKPGHSTLFFPRGRPRDPLPHFSWVFYIRREGNHPLPFLPGVLPGVGSWDRKGPPLPRGPDTGRGYQFSLSRLPGVLGPEGMVSSHPATSQVLTSGGRAWGWTSHRRQSAYIRIKFCGRSWVWPLSAIPDNRVWTWRTARLRATCLFQPAGLATACFFPDGRRVVGV